MSRTSTKATIARPVRADVQAVDLFCGVGGLTCGLRQAGVEVVAGVDVEGRCATAYEHNNGTRFWQQDVAELKGSDLAALFRPGALRLLAGCAPCQPFSRYTQGRDAEADPKWGLLGEFARLIEELRPDFVTMENVATLTRHRILARFLGVLERLGYESDMQVLACDRYGLPQFRRRLVLVASRKGLIKLPAADTAHVTVREAIGRMRPLEHGQQDTKDPLHSAATLAPLNLKRIQVSRPGGTWRDWPEPLRAACHQRATGKSYPSVYGRMRWDTAAPTMTTQCFGFGNGRFGHPEQDRAISLREAAILQSFPDDYRFLAPGQPVHFKTLGRMIGNAVPPLVGRLVGQTVLAAS